MSANLIGFYRNNAILHVITKWERRYLLLILSLVCFQNQAQQIEGNEVGYPFIKNYSPYEYKSHRQNWAITQSTEGLMYFGNGKGVLEFDGVNWRLISLPNRGHVRSIFTASDGTIYVGGNSELGYLAPDAKGRLVFNSLLQHVSQDKRDFGRVWTVFESNDGIYFQSYNYLFLWQHGKFKTWDFKDRLHRAFYVNNKVYGFELGKGLKTLEDDQFTLTPDGAVVKDFRVEAMLPLSKNQVLLGTRYNGFFKYDGSSIVPVSLSSDELLKTTGLYKAIQGPDSTLIIGSSLGSGIIILNKDGQLRQVIDESTGILNRNVLNVYLDRQNALWIGTQGGIARVELNSVFSVFDHRLGLDGTIQSVIRHRDTIFVGTSVGLHKMIQKEGKWRFKKIEAIPYYTWNTISIKDLLFIGTTYGTYIYKDGVSEHLVDIKETAAELIQSSYDPGTIWLAVDKGLARLQFKNDKWVFAGEILGISSAVRGVVEYKPDEIWLATKASGLFRIQLQMADDNALSLENAVITHYSSQQGVPVGDNRLRLIDNRLYIRSEFNKTFLFDDASNTFAETNYFNVNLELDGQVALPKKNKEQHGVIWLDVINQDGNSLAIARSILENTNTFNTQFYPIGEMIDRYRDSHHADVFYAEDNSLWWGGMNGIVRMNLKGEPTSLGKFQTIIRQIGDLNDSVYFAGNIFNQGPLELTANQNDLRVVYAAPFYQSEAPIVYQTKLEGDSDWSNWSNETKREFTNLWEGNYKFMVRAKNSFGEISDTATFSFSVSPPFHRSAWAFLMYFAGLVLLMTFITRWRSASLKREKIILENIVEERTEKVRRQAAQLKELDIMKSRFFANISHEFRTPLTLILAPIKKLLATTKTDNGDVENLKFRTVKIMERNAERLLRLVNQLLDLSKLEAGNMVLEAKYGNIIQFVRTIAYSFTSLAEQKEITYEIDCPEEEEGYFDSDIIDKIVSNLLSNAFKFTPDKGSITFSASFETNEDIGERGLLIAVKDSGKGISMGLQDKVFERFYQVDNSHTREQEGSGIGLALTKELVDLHHGKIILESEEGKGSTFRVWIPVEKASFSEEEITLNDKELLSDEVKNETGEHFVADTHIKEEDLAEVTSGELSGQEIPLILIVEDNDDLRFFIKDNLKREFRILEAHNGEEGLAIANEYIPDLVISDLMMPKMDGMALCRELKINKPTSHIPVILLTARANVETKLEGLETGADDYLTKPFNIDELVVRVKNLISQRKQLRELFGKEITLEPKAITINSVDQQFLDTLLTLMEDKMADPDFGVPEMQREVGMSKTQLHRKCKALTDQSPGEFMRNFRLKRAAHFLVQEGGNVTDAAYMVGFNNPSYFGKCFKDYFGESPSEYLLSHPKASG
ncbi:response regulator [Fulvivirgaceae bacterium BMA12]|uniref:histidine kinase n=1 Tax=Agaribacillus aureus TaxID=3051825 RepID=A0ABT8LIE5_9BACT|nr:response regulator [Fulvivirgaceae bacterium BMA12]